MPFRQAGEWLEDPDVAAIGGALGEYRFVGGAIRDALAGGRPGDLDMAVPIGPGETMSRLEEAGIRAHPTGYDHGVVLAVCGGRRIEVASLRRDLATDGRRAVVAYTADWREDAARRDFTMNAMSATPGCELFDYFGGRADLAEGRVRFVGDPVRRIREDVLRALRYFRFLALFPGGERDGPSFEAAVRAAPLTAGLSGERLHDEVLRLLALPEPTPVVGEMVGSGFFEPFLPAARNTERLARTVAAESRTGRGADPVRRLAALLDGSDAGRLRLSKPEAARLAALASPRPLDGKTLYREGRGLFLDRLLLAGGDEDALALHDGWDAPVFPLRGGDFLRAGLPRGPAVGEAARALEAWWADHGFRPDREACLAELKRRMG